MNSAAPSIVRTVSGLRDIVQDWHARGIRVGLVPTMGALHAGHLSLAELARSKADKVIVSIFVNPTQFAPHEDFDRYPRMLERDVDALAGHADLVFAPSAEDMYPKGGVTTVLLAGPALELESDFRPHFFAGVATIVAKLLIASTPDVAIFGEKDFQQLLVVQQLARDLLLPAEILGAPILREADGLAMSSRNAYLRPDERKIAGRMNHILSDAIKNLRAGMDVAAAETRAAHHLSEAGFQTVDYVAIRDAASLEKISDLHRPARILAAAKIGTTRLIDNMAV